MSKVIPIKEKAEKDLLTLTDRDMNMLKNMKKPPQPIRLVMEAVCIITQTPYERIPDPKDNSRRINSYWGPSLKMVGKSNFLNMLVDLNIDKVPTKIFAKLRSDYLIARKKDLNPKRIAKASSACVGLIKWIIAMCQYEEVMKVVKPKQAALNSANHTVNVLQAALKEKQEELDILTKKIEKL